MPIDTSFIPALEEELRMAHKPNASGQATKPGRIEAIEEQLRIHRDALIKDVEELVEDVKPSKRAVKKETADAPPAEPAAEPTESSPTENVDQKDGPTETTEA